VAGKRLRISSPIETPGCNQSSPSSSFVAPERNRPARGTGRRAPSPAAPSRSRPPSGAGRGARRSGSPGRDVRQREAEQRDDEEERDG
jgi:hypothetical protein